MAQYPQLAGLVTRINGRGPAPTSWSRVIEYLVGIWIDDYCARSKTNDIVETSVSDFSYLFDVSGERLLAAFGISNGRFGGARDASRMAGHPLSAGPLYHRGHAIPHTLGGPTDINLVPQRGSVNIGPFRKLERAAVATPGALYFTYWEYPRGDTQLPVGVDQGLLIPGQKPQVTTHPN
jgi:hypothetical protein